MFVNPDADLKNYPERLYGFLGKYFEYLSLSKYILFHSAPYYPLYGKERLLPEHYRKLFHEFKNNCRKDDTRIEKKYSRISNGKTLRKCVQAWKVISCVLLTPQSAIDYLLADLERKPNDESNLLQRLTYIWANILRLKGFRRAAMPFALCISWCGKRRLTLLVIMRLPWLYPCIFRNCNVEIVKRSDMNSKGF